MFLYKFFAWLSSFFYLKRNDYTFIPIYLDKFKFLPVCNERCPRYYLSENIEDSVLEESIKSLMNTKIGISDKREIEVYDTINAEFTTIILKSQVPIQNKYL